MVLLTALLPHCPPLREAPASTSRRGRVAQQGSWPRGLSCLSWWHYVPHAPNITFLCHKTRGFISCWGCPCSQPGWRAAGASLLLGLSPSVRPRSPREHPDSPGVMLGDVHRSISISATLSTTTPRSPAFTRFVYPGPVAVELPLDLLLAPQLHEGSAVLHALALFGKLPGTGQRGW